ncbi:MAG: NERD domain-containing protein [Alicyclobacillus sp.]|nr:NERD domain-containing protein [Alicyclobacillus sp.]
MLVVLTMFLLAAAALVKIFQPQLLGKRGEQIVAAKLAGLNPSVYRVMNDVVIPKEDNGTSQIDHVVVSPNRIFVIETKHYDGKIFGKEHDYRWTQVFYKRKHSFLNPIIQNKGHIKTLQAVLAEFMPVKFVSIVVFSGRGDLKVQTTTTVVYPSELRKVIAEHTEEVIPPERVEAICNKLASIARTDRQEKRNHVQHVRQTVAAKKAMVQQDICPRCGGQLRVRNGKYGPFKGCSNYPKCQFKLRLEG